MAFLSHVLKMLQVDLVDVYNFNIVVFDLSLLDFRTVKDRHSAILVSFQY